MLNFILRTGENTSRERMWPIYNDCVDTDQLSEEQKRQLDESMMANQSVVNPIPDPNAQDEEWATEFDQDCNQTFQPN